MRGTGLIKAGRPRCWLAAILLLAGAGLPAQAGAASPAAAASNPIVAENALPGTPGWDQGSPSPTYSGLDGYTSEVSVTPGQSVHLHVTAPAGVSYRVEVYRLGWYNGVGARLVQCLPGCTTDEPAVVTPPLAAPDPQTGYLDANWPITDVVTVGSSWVSGYYMAKLTETVGNVVGEMKLVPFIVREAAPRSAILVQAGVNTWQAYNSWGGASLYGSQGGAAAVKVSFNRPYGPGQGPLTWDYQLIRFLERNGYDVSYATDLDTAQGLDWLSSRRLVITSGHDEYWTMQMRDAFDAVQASGSTNLAFMGANTGFWQMRYADAYRSILEYRGSTLDPQYGQPDETTQFRQLTPARPECLLEGVQFLSGGTSPPVRSYMVAPGALGNSWFSGTGFTSSSVVIGVVGYEWDRAGLPGCPQVQQLLTWSGTDSHNMPSTADAVTFTAASGSRVFAAGTLQYSWGLDAYGHPQMADPQLQAFTTNMLNDLSSPSAGPPVPSPPVNTWPPAVSGSVAVGQTLSSSTGTWTGSPTSFNYQWQDCGAGSCADIPGATGSSHALTAGDVGHALRVVVTANNAGGSTPATSLPTSTISPPPPVNTSPPALSGSVAVGQTLSSSTGTWTGSPTSFNYQWQDCGAGSCADIPGATGSSHALTAGDVGHALRVVVTANNAGGSTPATSLPTSAATSTKPGPANRPPRARAPRVSGVRVARFAAMRRTTLTLVLSEPATVTVLVASAHRARLHVRKRCLRARKGQPCQMTVRRAKLKFPAAEGRNRFTFRVPALSPGSYRLTLTALDAGRMKSKPVTRMITINLP